MPIHLKWLLKLPTGRLSRRVAVWVFISVIVIETIIFIPSFQNRKKELLNHIRDISSAKIAMLMDLAGSTATHEELLAYFKKLPMDPRILGGTVYHPGGEVIGHFGESPTLTSQQVFDTGETGRLDRKNTRYDAMAASHVSHPDLQLIIRHDASSVKKELLAYVLRIAGLVVIISLFVTAAAMVALEPIVLTPILRLRGDLISAGEAILNDREAPEFYSSSVRREDELGEVISAFVRGHKQITEAIAERKKAERSLQESFQQVAAYSRALNKEMEQGRQMQANFFPDRLPQKPGWAFEAFFKPARQVSGDFYDIFELPGNKVGVVIADVCDKGVGAALFMALFRSLIRIFSGQTSLKGLELPTEKMQPAPAPAQAFQENPNFHHTSALEAVRLTNNYIVQNHEDLGMFATLFFGVLCPKTGCLAYINGGHEQLIITGLSGVKQTLPFTGPAVGLTVDPPFRIEQATLAPGDILFGYTDGVSEARSKADSLFGRKRLSAVLDAPFYSTGQLLGHVRSNLAAFVGSAPQEDDITMLAVQRLPRTTDMGLPGEDDG